MYAVASSPIKRGDVVPDNPTIFRAKGIPRNYVSANYTIKTYLDVLKTSQSVYASYKAINLDNFQAVTKNIRKCSLSAADSKKFQSCSIHTYAHGSSLISENKDKGCLFCREDEEWERKRLKAKLRYQQRLRAVKEDGAVPRKKLKVE